MEAELFIIWIFYDWNGDNDPKNVSHSNMNFQGL